MQLRATRLSSGHVFRFICRCELAVGTSEGSGHREHAPVLPIHTPSSISEQSAAPGWQTGDKGMLQGHAHIRAQTDSTTEAASSSSVESPSRDSSTGNEEESVRDSLEGRRDGRVQGVGVGEGGEVL